MRTRRGAPEVNRTKPGSKLDFRVDYGDYKKWTSDRPGDGIDSDQEDYLEDIFGRGDVKRALKKLEKATGEFIKSGNKKPLEEAADAMKLDNGSEVATDVLREVHKGEKKQLENKSTPEQKKVVEAVGIAKKRVKASMIDRIANRVAGFGDVELSVNVRDVFDMNANFTEDDISVMQNILFDSIVANGQVIEDILREQVSSDPRYGRVVNRVASSYFADSYEAGLGEVLSKIIKRIRDKNKAHEMGQNVFDYNKTHDDSVDLTPRDTRMLYGPDDYGERTNLSKHKMLDIGWTDHAEYRSDLRDVPHAVVNKVLKNILRERAFPQIGKKPRLKSRGPEKLKVPGGGTAVVDYDLTRNPAEADVITVWASRRGR